MMAPMDAAELAGWRARLAPDVTPADVDAFLGELAQGVHEPRSAVEEAAAAPLGPWMPRPATPALDAWRRRARRDLASATRCDLLRTCAGWEVSALEAWAAGWYAAARADLQRVAELVRAAA